MCVCVCVCVCAPLGSGFPLRDTSGLPRLINCMEEVDPAGATNSAFVVLCIATHAPLVNPTPVPPTPISQDTRPTHAPTPVLMPRMALIPPLYEGEYNLMSPSPREPEATKVLLSAASSAVVQ